MALAAKAFTLAFVLTATDKMSQVIDRAINKSLGSLSSFERNTGKIGGELMKNGMQMLNFGTAAAGGMVAMSKATADYAGDMMDMSRITGVGFEKMQELSYAAKMSGIEADKLKTAFVKLNKVVTEAAGGNETYMQTFRNLGISLTDAAGNMRKPDEIFEDIANVFSKSEDNATKTAMAYTLLGKSGADLIPMLNDGKNGLEEWYRLAREAHLVLNDDVGRSAETAGDKMDGLTHKLRGTSLQLGARLLPSMTAFVEKLDATLSRVLEWIDSNPKLATSIGQIAMQGAKWLIILGSGSIALGGISMAIGKVGKVIQTVSGIMKAGSIAKGLTSLLTPMGWIKVAVMAIVALAYVVIRNWKSISEFFVNLWDKVKGAFQTAWNWIARLLLNYTPQGLIIKHWDVISGFFVKLWDKVKAAFKTAWEWIARLFLNYTPQGLIIKNWSSIVTFFANLWDNISTGISNSWNRIMAWFGNLRPVEWIRGAWDSVGEFFSELGVRFFEWGKNLITALWNGIVSVADWAVEGIKNLGKKIADGFKSILGIHSPSKLFTEYGMNITQGLVVGIDRGGSAVEEATAGMAAIATGDITPASDVMSSVGGVSVNYSPHVTINGSVSAEIRDEFVAMLRRHADDIVDIVARSAANTARLSFR